MVKKKTKLPLHAQLRFTSWLLSGPVLLLMAGGIASQLFTVATPHVVPFSILLGVVILIFIGWVIFTGFIYRAYTSDRQG